MAYKKGNRATTDEQFSKGTTIDGSRIDKALGDIVEKHNEIPTGDTEARWTPNTYSVSWSSPRPSVRHANSNPNGRAGSTRSGCNVTDQLQRDWFPFLISRNTPAEIFPATNYPSDGIQAEFRNKGYWVDKTVDSAAQAIPRWQKTPPVSLGVFTYQGSDCNDTAQALNTWAASGGAWGNITNLASGNGPSPLQWRYFTLQIPMYFKDPVIITNVSVFGAQEHPYSPYNGYLDTSGGGNTQYQISATDGYKDPGVATGAGSDFTDPVQPQTTVGNAFEGEVVEEVLNGTPSADTYLAATTGMERPGELYTATQQNFGDGTIQILLDDKFQPEKPELASVLFTQSDLGDSTWRFNRNPTTNNHNTSANGSILADDCGQRFEDMSPRFGGGSTWGTWVKQDNLNIPIPADSRVRFCVIVRGIRPSFIFDWHLALSFLEQTK
jgi:hypothetical protein